MAKNEVKVSITGDTSGLEAAARRSDAALGKFGGSASKSSKLIGGAITGAAVAVGAFGLSAVKSFESAGKETAKLQRLTGGTAEEMSALRFIGQQTGVSFETLTKGTVAFAKSMAGPGKAALEGLGVSLRTSAGGARPFMSVLGDVADKFSQMPNGIDKTALATKLFGRAGNELAPMLNRGRDGLQALTKKAEEMGLVLGQGSIDSIKKQVAAQRDLSAAVEGLKFKIGEALLPVMEQAVGVLTTVTAAFGDLPGPMRELIVGAATLGAAWALLNNGPLAGIGRGIKTFVGSLIEARASGESLSTTLGGMVNPAVLGVTAVIAAGAGIYMAWSKNVQRVDDESKQLSKTLLQQGSEVVPSLIASLQNVLNTRDSFDESFRQTGVTMGQVAAIVNKSTGDFDNFRKILHDMVDENPLILAQRLRGVGYNADEVRAKFSQLDPALQAVIRQLLGMVKAGTLSQNAFREFIDAGTDVDQGAMKTAENIKSVGEAMAKTVGETNLSADAQTQLATALGKGNPSLEERQKAVLALAAAYPEAAQAAGLIVPQTDDAAAAIGDVAGKSKDAKTALEDYQSAITDMFSPLDGLADANTKVAKAQADVNTAAKEHGKKSPEYIAATQALIRANVDQEAAQAKLADAFKTGKVTVEGVIATYQNWVAQGKMTQDQANIAAYSLAGLANQASKIDGKTVSVPVKVDTSTANAALDAFYSKIDKLKTAAGRIAIGQANLVDKRGGFFGGRAGGGPVQAGGTYLVGEEGPELVTFAQSGTVIPNDQLARSSRTMTPSGSTGNSYTINIQAGMVADQRALGSAIVDAIAAHERSNGKAWRAAA